MVPLPFLSVSLPHAPEAWAASGGMALTGDPGSPPLAPPAPIANVLTATGISDAAALVGERGRARRGSISAGGATRLLPCADGWLVVALPRPSDLDAVPAWLGVHAAWDAVARACLGRTAAEAVETACLLEIPAAQVASLPAAASPWAITAGPPGDPVDRPLLVVDLSTLWAGPLCGDLLERAGALVVKVEDPRRPDGARRGSVPFFDLLNGAKRSVAMDIRSDAFRALLRRADVVVSSARPRAFEQLGIDPRQVLQESPTVWVAITAYGWSGPDRNRVGFGDDVAAAAGLVTWNGSGPRFVADAVADPLCGALAAYAAQACLASGGSWLVDASLAAAASYAAALAPDDVTHVAASEEWFREGVPVAAPRVRDPRGRAPALGVDTADFLGR